MKIFSSNDPSKQDEPSITLQRDEVTQVQAPSPAVRHPQDTTQRKMTGNNDLFFLTNYHSLIASLSRFLGGAPWTAFDDDFFLAMITFFQNI